MDGRFFPAGTIVPLGSWERAQARPTLAAAPAGIAAGSLHDPPLEPRDEAVFLLTAAAEIEHALMVQYLYAAWSVRVTGPDAPGLQQVRDRLRQIAREEMGHLATVENLLLLVGGPLHLGREHSAVTGSIYPFRFALEPVTLSSLAKYVTAESPAVHPPGMSVEDRALVEQLRADGAAANGGQEIRHVGPVFDRLAALFDDDADGLSDDDIRLDSSPRQAKAADWGFDPPRGTLGEPLVIPSLPDAGAAEVRAAAAAAVREIGAQGEGFDIGGAGTESHFERFLDLYKRVSALSAAGTALTWPVATDPNTVPSGVPAATDAAAAAAESRISEGRITAPRARAWAQLFDLRYRMLLGQFAHFLQLDSDLYRDEPGPQLGDRTARGLLLLGTFAEMRRLEKIGGTLVRLPKDDPPGPLHAGAPFELPYTLDLPDGEAQRWRGHLDVSRAATRLIRADLDPVGDEFLADLLQRDEADQQLMQSLATGGGLPAGSLPTGFAKAVTILEESVRGFSIGAHGHFWAGRTREEFLDARVFGQPPVARTPEGTLDRDPDAAPLVQRLEAPPPDRMPRYRPAVPAERIGFLRSWIADGCPDDVPAGQVGVRHERSPADEPPPAPGGVPGFAADVAGLFRPDDRTSMLFRFDLHRYEDVRDHATAILARLEDGTMPCDQAWPPERIAVFRRWIDGGRQP